MRASALAGSRWTVTTNTLAKEGKQAHLRGPCRFVYTFKEIKQERQFKIKICVWLYLPCSLLSCSGTVFGYGSIFFTLNFLLRTFFFYYFYIIWIPCKGENIIVTFFVCLYLFSSLIRFFFFIWIGFIGVSCKCMSVSFIILWTLKHRSYEIPPKKRKRLWEKNGFKHIKNGDTNISNLFFFFSFLDWKIVVKVSNIIFHELC